MSALGPQTINSSYVGLLQVPGGVTSTLQNVQDGAGNPTGIQLSTTSVGINDLAFANASNISGGIAGNVPYQTSPNHTAFVAPGTAGQVFTSNGTNAPYWSTVSQNFTQSGTGAITYPITSKIKEIVSVRDYGAVGDGTTNDTTAFQNALNYACLTKNVSIYIPAGRYKISGSLSMALTPVSGGQNHFKVDVHGDGEATQLLQYGDGPLFEVSGEAHQLSFRSFNVICKTTFSGSGTTLNNKAVFYFPSGNAESEFSYIRYTADSGETTYGQSFYVCGASASNDSVYFNNCTAVVNGWGYKFGVGSSMFLNCGRILGLGPDTQSIGMYLSGGNNVWMYGIDFNGLQTGLNVTQENGTTNRELFIAQCSFDYCYNGIYIEDASYANIIGCWAASCNGACINYNPISDDGVLNINGGTIFNAGQAAGTKGSMYGLSINRYGQILVSGVSFRNNKSRAVSANNGFKTSPSIIQNCNFYANGDAGIANSCQVFVAGAVQLTNNTFTTGSVPNALVEPTFGAYANIHDNLGYTGFGLRTPPALGASAVAVTNSTGQRLHGYIRGGVLNYVLVNGQAVYNYATPGPANELIILNPNDTFTIAYTAAPNINWNFA